MAYLIGAAAGSTATFLALAILGARRRFRAACAAGEAQVRAASEAIRRQAEERREREALAAARRAEAREGDGVIRVSDEQAIGWRAVAAHGSVPGWGEA